MWLTYPMDKVSVDEQTKPPPKMIPGSEKEKQSGKKKAKKENQDKHRLRPSSKYTRPFFVGKEINVGVGVAKKRDFVRRRKWKMPDQKRETGKRQPTPCRHAGTRPEKEY